MSAAPAVRSRRRAAYVTLVGGYANVLLSTVGGLVLVPFYLHYIGSRMYGAWLGSGGILAWLAVLDLGLASLMIQRIADAHGTGERMRIGEYLSTGLLLQLAMFAVMMAGATLLAPHFPGWMDIDGGEAALLSGAFLLAAAANGINFLNNGVAGFLRALQITVLPNVVATLAAVVGLVSTFIMLLQGIGLWSIPAGLIVTGVLQLLVNVPYCAFVYVREVDSPLRPTRDTLRDFVVVSVPLLASKLGSAAMSRSDSTLISIFLRPELATAFVLTRRAADVVLRFLDRFGAAAFAGFAHLTGGGNRDRVAEVYRQILQGYTSAGAVMVGAYLAGNAAFVDLWVGSPFFLGQGLTMLLGMAAFAGGASSLVNYLLGATGRIGLSSAIATLEAVVRFPLMLILLLTVGAVGLPIAVLATAVAAGLVSRQRTFRQLGAGPRRHPGDLRALAIKAGIVAAGAAVGMLWRPDSWLGLTLLLGAFATIAVSVLLVAVPELRATLLPGRLRVPLSGANGGFA